MLKKFVLRNYKNFKDSIVIDFGNTAGYQFNLDCVTDGLISKMLIYGRNATGKTNLGEALMNIQSTLFSRRFLPRGMRTGNFLNADSDEVSASFSYIFQFGDDEVTYHYRRLSGEKLQDEELLVNGLSVFKCDHVNRNYEDIDIGKLEIVGVETANPNIYLQALEEDSETEDAVETGLPFLRWLINNTVTKSDSVLFRLSNYVRRMDIIRANRQMGFGTSYYQKFYEYLENPDHLSNLEEFLNEMGIVCKLRMEKLPDDQRELYFVHEKLVPFYENASSGTRVLFDLYRRFITRVVNSSFVYLDEFDAFYHYEMAENVVRFFKKNYPKSQIVMTTHNTNLMTNRLMRPDCLFILSQTGKLTSLCNATERELREGHNLEKMYISGEFEQYE